MLFIPGNAGSFRQVRALAASSALMHHAETLAKPMPNPSESSSKNNARFDYFTVDFQEDLTAFHGKSLYDQADYLNDAVQHILSLYQKHESFPPSLNRRSPLPEAVILIGHSMGGIVARTMFTLPNFRKDSVNCVFTLSSPHTLPPISFDSEIVGVYDKVNRFWEESFSQDIIGRNPLASVSVISIAGGSLDTMISSDSAGISSTVPPSNGFTVLTNSIPHVWTGIDHQAIVWCDQFRHVFAAAMRDMADTSVPSQTKNLNKRMAVFRKHFLGGFEMDSYPNYLETKFHSSLIDAESPRNFILPKIQKPDTVLWVKDVAKPISLSNQQLVVDKLGSGPTSFMMPIPPASALRNLLFTLLTDTELITEQPANSEVAEVIASSKHNSRTTSHGIHAMACRYPHTEAKPSLHFGDSLKGSNSELKVEKLVGLVCRNIGSDVFKMPKAANSNYPLSAASTSEFFSVVQYNVSQLADYDLIAIVDTNETPSPGFAIAEFTDKSSSRVNVFNPLRDFIRGVSVTLPASRPSMVDISYPSIWSSLLAFKVHTEEAHGSESPKRLFTNFIRQYSGHDYDSKFFLNVGNSSVLNVTIFGVAPFTPFGVRQPDDDFANNLFHYGQDSHYYHNLHLQVWSDGQGQDLTITIKVDILASLGKLVLHYRAAVAVFPAAVVVLILLLQFRVFAASGLFISFLDGLKMLISQYILPILVAVAILPFLLWWSPVKDLLYTIEPEMDYLSGDGPSNIFTHFRRNQFFLGLEPGHIWFLGPLFLCVSIGVCFLVFHVLSLLVHIPALVIFHVRKHLSPPASKEFRKGSQAAWPNTRPQKLRKVIVTAILFLSVASVAPHEFAFLVGCFVQISTTIRAAVARKGCKSQEYVMLDSFYNMAFSSLMLMFWIIPITAPMLLVWIRGIAINKSVFIHTHHNLLAICPMIWFVEIMGTGRPIPRPATKFQQVVTQVVLGYIFFYALVFGIPRAYMLYHLFNAFSVWLVYLYLVSPKPVSYSPEPTNNSATALVAKNQPTSRPSLAAS